ncbi:hypothetical protein PVK06_011140 [Gossypium arboreum]|uniref:Uncharacterized protein n=1 Tax=Gossypium arboreum TaxID=29729 RepID=A0ABR0Q877_GOSAR|nr:hypothetical protein PVK06_011140 [Gossypium arboreum]
MGLGSRPMAEENRGKSLLDLVGDFRPRQNSRPLERNGARQVLGAEAYVLTCVADQMPDSAGSNLVLDPMHSGHVLASASIGLNPALGLLHKEAGSPLECFRPHQNLGQTSNVSSLDLEAVAGFVNKDLTAFISSPKDLATSLHVNPTFEEAKIGPISNALDPKKHTTVTFQEKLDIKSKSKSSLMCKLEFLQINLKLKLAVFELLIAPMRDCNAARLIWDKLIPQQNLSGFHFRSFSDWMRSNLQSHLTSLDGIDWPCLFRITMWRIWKNQNLFIFQGITWSVDEIIKISYSWAKQYSSTSQFSYHNWRNRFDEDFAADGGCVRDHNGEWIIGFAKYLGKCTVLEVELSGNSRWAESYFG